MRDGEAATRQFGTMGTAARNTGVTTGREVLAYILAQVIRIAVLYLVNYSGILMPVYRWAFQSGIMIATYVVSTSFSVVWGAVGLLLFLLLRGALAGTPVFVAGRANERAVASSGAEIGAYIAAFAISLVGFTAVNIAFLGTVYRDLAQSHQTLLVFALSLTVSLINTAIVFILFIALRWAFTGRQRAPAM
jgi:hypothetical protein